MHVLRHAAESPGAIRVSVDMDTIMSSYGSYDGMAAMMVIGHWSAAVRAVSKAASKQVVQWCSVLA